MELHDFLSTAVPAPVEIGLTADVALPADGHEFLCGRVDWNHHQCAMVPVCASTSDPYLAGGETGTIARTGYVGCRRPGLPDRIECSPGSHPVAGGGLDRQASWEEGRAGARGADSDLDGLRGLPQAWSS